MINILICDDDKNILEQVNNLVTDWGEKNKVDFCIDTKSSGEFINDSNTVYDIAFIDIEMPGISGLELAEELKKNNPDVIVIVITSFQNYLDSAMKIHVFRYLSKPIDTNRFYNNFSEAIESYNKLSKTITVESKGEITLVKTSDILYIENLKHGSIIVTKMGEYKTSIKPKEWLKIINQPNCFVYSHTSIIVNLQSVVGLAKNTVSLDKGNGERITTYVSQRKYADFKKALFSFAGCSM